jgi:hypothetical protein
VCFLTILVWENAHAVASGGIELPGYSDKYSNFVRQLEAGRTNINYAEFRNSFLASEQFKVAGVRHVELHDLRKRLRQLMRQSNHAQVAKVATQMLGIDYTDMEAHKALRQASKLSGNTANAEKHHDIEFGLLYSIIRKGDGKACQTGWPVIQIAEEYFILEMAGAKLLQQSLDNSGGLCDKMEVQTPEGRKTYYFEVSKVFEGYDKRGIR